MRADDPKTKISPTSSFTSSFIHGSSELSAPSSLRLKSDFAPNYPYYPRVYGSETDWWPLSHTVESLGVRGNEARAVWRKKSGGWRAFVCFLNYFVSVAWSFVRMHLSEWTFCDSSHLHFHSLACTFAK